MTISLNPGLCCQAVNFNVTATDNCPFVGPVMSLATITAGGNGNATNGMVWFDVTNNTGGPIEITDVASNITGATMINVYTKAGTHVGFQTNAGAWTLAASADATTGPFSGAFPGNGTITPAPY
ncbi:MAG: hypothetical protein R2788_04605 [Saprospiraceae bacterium]